LKTSTFKHIRIANPSFTEFRITNITNPERRYGF